METLKHDSANEPRDRISTTSLPARLEPNCKKKNWNFARKQRTAGEESRWRRQSSRGGHSLPRSCSFSPPTFPVGFWPKCPSVRLVYWATPPFRRVLIYRGRLVNPSVSEPERRTLSPYEVMDFSPGGGGGGFRPPAQRENLSRCHVSASPLM